MRCYIAGPMRGYDNYNFPAFYAAEAALECRGFVLVNPARMDIEAGEASWCDTAGQITLAQDFSFARAMRRDICAITTCDAIVVLPGWEASVGAKHEVAVARMCGLKVYTYEGDGVATELDGEACGTELGLTRGSLSQG